MSKHVKNYTDPEVSIGTDGLVQEEIAEAAEQSQAEERVMEALAADALIATTTQEPPPDDYHALLLLLRSLDGPQHSLRSTGYSRPSFPQISDFRTP
jgi:hypothetical protein